MKQLTLLCALACTASAAAAQNGAPASGVSDTLRLSRRQAIATALMSNPQIDIAREQTAQVRAQRVENNGLTDPLLAYSYDDETGFLRLGTAASRNLNLALGIPFPDKFRLRNTIGVANIHSSEAQFRLAQQTIAAQTGRVYDSVLVTRLHRRDLTEARDLAADFLKRTQARFAAGTVARLDVIKAQVDVAQSENDLIANTRDVANANAALNRIVGRPLGAPVDPTDSLAVPDGIPGLDALEARALAVRPEIAGLEAQLRGAHANSQLTKEQTFLPDITLGANKDFASDVGTLYTAGLAMPLPIFFWQHTKGDFAETKHRELELSATLRDARAAVGQDVRASFAAADAAVRQATFIRDQLLPSAREAYRVATVSYGLGGLSALDVLDARRVLLDAERQYADALAAANSALSDLERAAGAPLSTIDSGANRE
jgi:cobalt-zinc-cadmium efflux system outer membrane protein